MRTWVARAAAIAIVGAGLPLALAASPASAAGCTSLNQVVNGSGQVLLNAVSAGPEVGTVYTGLGSGTTLPVGTSRYFVITCDGANPKVGERFYVLMRTTINSGLGYSPYVDHTLRLPSGVYASVNNDNPVACWKTGTFQVVSPCVGDVDTGMNNIGNPGFDWYLNSTTYFLHQNGTLFGPAINSGQSWWTALPVVAIAPFTSSTYGNAMWGGAYVHFPGGLINDYAFSGTYVTVNDQAPALFYPSDKVSAVTSNSATLKATVYNFWKAGTAQMQYGTTSSYGMVSATDAIPGNDPVQPGYSTTQALSGLLPSTTYHWRIKFTVTATGATYYGPDQTFTTLAAGQTRDITQPTVTVSALPAASTATATLRWTASDNVALASFTVQYRTVSKSGVVSAWSAPTSLPSSARSTSLALTKGVKKCARVTAVDAAGNTRTSLITCTVMPFDNPSLTQAGSWVSTTDAGAYGGSIRTSKSAGASQSLSGATGTKVVVVATKRVGAGTLNVLVNGVVKATWNLASATTLKQQTYVVTLPAFTSATVAVKVKTPGTGVTVDGLGVG